MRFVVPDSYREWAPDTGLYGTVTCVWARTTGAGAPRTYRIVPDGCVDVLWTGRELLVAGPDTGPVLFRTPAGTMIGIRFAPGMSPAVLGLPASELRDQRPLLADLGRLPADRVDALTDALAAAGGELAAGEILQRAVRDWFRPDLPDPALPAVLAALRSGSSVGTLADDLGIGERALHRRCRTAFGYGPKTAQRVLRFHRALGMARAGVPLARVAADAGYADQPHLAREVRALAGVPLGELLSGRTSAG